VAEMFRRLEQRDRESCHSSRATRGGQVSTKKVLTSYLLLSTIAIYLTPLSRNDLRYQQ
jgi:hypothetical protein